MITEQLITDSGCGEPRAEAAAPAQTLARYLGRSAARHVAAVNALANEVKRPVEEIHAVYHAELSQLARRAAVLDYLPVLVMKRVRERYRVRLRALRQSDSRW